jgi:hypothetical protein
MTETWKPVPIPQYADLYEVSDWGRVRRRHPPLILRASPTGLHRNLQIKLHDKGVTIKNCMLSHLVMAAFGEDPCGRPIGYRDGNLRNCRLDNLFFLSTTAAQGGGHVAHGVMLSLQQIAGKIWGELLPETQALLHRSL